METRPHGTGGRTILIEDSQSVYFELGIADGGDYTLPHRGTYVGSWSPSFVDDDVQVRNSTLEQIDVDLGPDLGEVIIRNTTDLEFGWVFGTGSTPEGTGVIDGLARGHYGDSSFEADGTTLRLINTSVDGWWPTVFRGFHLTVRNSDLVDPRAWENSTFTIEDSSLYLYAAYADSVSSLENVEIENNVYAEGNAQIAITGITTGGYWQGYTARDSARITVGGIQVAP